MLTRSAIAVALAALFSMAACRPVQPPPAALPASTPVVRAYTQFPPGCALNLVQTQLGLDACEVRYRSSMPDGEMGMVYFLDDGNLHIDAKKAGDTWVLLSTPLLEPSPLPPADRVAEWDRGADPQNRNSKSER